MGSEGKQTEISALCDTIELISKTTVHILVHVFSKWSKQKGGFLSFLQTDFLDKSLARGILHKIRHLK